jgi:two-component system, OmpR family, response regulator
MNQRETHNETILVVDDEDTILDLLSAALRFAGFRVQTAATGRDALAAVRDAEPDLIVLDVNLPDVDGFEVCRRLREGQHEAPVIFLTARDAAVDLRTGFTRGGDDYLNKPFSLEELMLRIQAILRRTRGTQTESARLISGELVLDQEAHRVWRGEHEVSLSPTEFRLLRYLMLNRDRVVSRQQILDHVWDYDFYGEPTAVETYISYLRRKLDDRSGQLIRTVRGVGYSLRTPQTGAWAS